jgi:hypothetical protein
MNLDLTQKEVEFLKAVVDAAFKNGGRIQLSDKEAWQLLIQLSDKLEMDKDNG